MPHVALSSLGVSRAIYTPEQKGVSLGPEVTLWGSISNGGSGVSRGQMANLCYWEIMQIKCSSESTF